MGGCRCSYPNCTVKSDGVTHMFHYPVFDRVRCHQWLVNTNRLEFLNLKVSQLKNRVICQHHFKDSYFMNFKKEKLKFNAVPTEMGPYCDLKQGLFESTTEEVPKVYDISLDDIENEFICCEDKKANFSVKYGNFLTNCDLSELDTLNQTNKNEPVEENIKAHSNIFIEIDGKNQIVNSAVTSYDNLQGLVQNSEFPSVFEGNKPNLLSIEFEDVNSLDQNKLNKSNNFPTNNSILKHKTNIKNERRIQIISEKKISESIPIIGKLEPVSPSLVLRIPNKNKNIEYNKTNHEVTFQVSQNLQKYSNDLMVNEEIEQNLPMGANSKESNLFIEISNVNIEPHNNAVDDTELSKKSLSHYKTQTENKASLLSQNISNNRITEKRQINVKRNVRQDKPISFPTNKIPAARIAAIDKKRKFNMKLRDIIESCLDKIDDEDTCSVLSKAKDKIEEKKTDVPKPNVQEYSLAFLEARIKKMEDNLLNKIDQNSQKIVDLKNSFVPITKNKLSPTHTLSDEMSHKKYLYNEISKYLSPEANSLIYEELFINKIVQKVPKASSPSKRRRCR